MSNFINKSDYTHKQRDAHLNQIIDDNDALLDGAELTAISEVKMYLFEHYDVDTIFASEAEQRHPMVLKWCLNIALYELYERIPDEAVPERIIKNYDDTVKQLREIAANKISIDLPRKTEGEDNESITRFQGGSEPLRSH